MNKENPTDKPKHLTSTVAFNNASKKSPRRQLLMKRAGGEFVFYTLRQIFGTRINERFVDDFFRQMFLGIIVLEFHVMHKVLCSYNILFE